MVNTILARRGNHIVAKGGNPVWPKGSKSRGFSNSCLQRLIRQGLTANADLAVARLQVEEAQATLRQSKLAYLPSLQLEPTGTLSSFDGSKTQKTYNVGASASWEIDLFGKLRNSKRQALASLLSSDAYRQMMQTQVC